jgi:hypothetical protein
LNLSVDNNDDDSGDNSYNHTSDFIPVTGFSLCDNNDNDNNGDSVKFSNDSNSHNGNNGNENDNEFFNKIENVYPDFFQIGTNK